jgi:EpsD family peptidyl-prolyl cis-trans isomerase
MNKKHAFFVIVAALGLSLTACESKKTAPAADAKAAVKVNGQAILDAELQAKTAMHGGKEGAPHMISEQALQSTVNMELMRQAAVQDKLDQDPNVRAKIAISMRSILAMAYMEKLLGSVKKPTDAEIQDFYKQHPELYSDRKLYELRELLIDASHANAAEIQEQLAKAGKHDPFEKWLAQKNIPFKANMDAIPADQVTASLMQKLKDLPINGHVIMEGTGPLHVVFLLSKQPQPIELAMVAPQIANRLDGEKRKGIMDATIKQLNEKAKIEYVAPYTAKGLMVAPKE